MIAPPLEGFWLEMNGLKSPPIPARGLRTILEVAELYCVTPEMITGPARNSSLVHARAIVAMALHRKGWSYPRIGRSLGGRDHTTIMNLVRRFPAYCAKDRRMQAILEACMA